MRCCAMLSLALFALGLSTPLQANPPTTAITDFKLKNCNGKYWTLGEASQGKKALVVVFIGTECPVNNLYMPRLVELEKTYRDKGVGFVAINGNEHDTMETIRAHAIKYALSFPVLQDEKNIAVDRFGAVRHPSAYLLDDRHIIRYRGRIDDQYGIGYQRSAPGRHDLIEAIDALLAGKTISTTSTSVEGCYITRAPMTRPFKTGITYAREISRILQKHCQECHRPGQIGPMSLSNYEDASSWSQMIREVVTQNRMPPWHADPKHGTFKNDRRLSKEESDQIIAWIDAGCSQGQEHDLPQTKKFQASWNIGKPDVVFSMPDPITVPARAKGGIPYKYVRVATDFTEDKWIQAVEAKPGNNAVVHHIIVYVFPGFKRAPDLGDGIGNGMLVAYAPGDLGNTFAPGSAKKIPKGSTLVFQMHYTPNGTEQSDRSSIGLIFAREPPKAEIKTRAIAQQAFMIPPHADHHRVVSKTTFSKEVILYSFFPHMHLRGKDFQFDVHYPDGKREILLSVPRYDFGWQSNYILDRPLCLPAGSRIECTAHFDNSEKNPNNPNPASLVFWGEQTWQEMMIGFVDYAYAEALDRK